VVQDVQERENRPFWALFAAGWTLVGASYALSRAVGVQLADASTFHHILYIAGYALIGAAFWAAPERGTPRQAWLVAGVLLVSVLVYAFVVTPLLSDTISGGGRGGPWEYTEPLRNRGITSVSLAVVATLAVEAWLRLKGFTKAWQAVLFWPALGVTLAFVTDWITIFARKSESLESVSGLTVALFFVQVLLLGIGVYRAFRLERAARPPVPAPAA
jgi:hypothetical protein